MGASASTPTASDPLRTMEVYRSTQTARVSMFPKEEILSLRLCENVGKLT
jgi:hypothetical protein